MSEPETDLSCEAHRAKQEATGQSRARGPLLHSQQPILHSLLGALASWRLSLFRIHSLEDDVADAFLQSAGQRHNRAVVAGLESDLLTPWPRVARDQLELVVVDVIERPNKAVVRGDELALPHGHDEPAIGGMLVGANMVGQFVARPRAAPAAGTLGPGGTSLPLLGPESPVPVDGLQTQHAIENVIRNQPYQRRVGHVG